MNDLFIQEKEHEAYADCKAIHAEVRADSESLVPYFQGSFQRKKKAMGGDQATFTEARTQSHSFFAHRIRSKGSMDALRGLCKFRTRSKR